jgi:hypothetical protein
LTSTATATSTSRVVVKVIVEDKVEDCRTAFGLPGIDAS